MQRHHDIEGVQRILDEVRHSYSGLLSRRLVESELLIADHGAGLDVHAHRLDREPVLVQDFDFD